MDKLEEDLIDQGIEEFDLDDVCMIDDFDDEILGMPVPRKARKASEPTEDDVKARAIRSKQRAVMRKALSEQHMNEVLDWHLEDGCAYHVISGGDVDFLTYMRGIVKQHPLEYLLCSTWCMAMEDAQEIVGWLRRGLVKRADIYVGEIFIQHYMSIFEFLASAIPEYGGRLCMQRNHAKVMVGYWRESGDTLGGVVVTSRANINTNPRIEQAVITVDREVADFYKAFFDDLKPKNPWPLAWSPWEAERCRTRSRAATSSPPSRTRGESATSSSWRPSLTSPRGRGERTGCRQEGDTHCRSRTTARSGSPRRWPGARTSTTSQER